jgi:hypothetical protein
VIEAPEAGLVGEVVGFGDFGGGGAAVDGGVAGLLGDTVVDLSGFCATND